MRGGIPIGRVFGISIKLHYSWFFIFAIVTWALTVGYFPATYPAWSLAVKIGAGLVTSVLFFGSVLLHELMHSVVAIHQGMKIQGITLFFLGGVSEMAEEPKTAGDEFRMAGAGPLSSLILGGIFLGIYFSLGKQPILAGQVVSAVAFYLGYINVLLGVFNLIPGFPLDGGRVLRSIIWARNKNLQSATRISSGIGRMVGFFFIGVGIYVIFVPQGFLFIQGGLVNGIWLAIIGWFLESAAVGSYRQLLLQEMLKGHTAGEIMSQDCVPVPPNISVERLVNENILPSGRRCFPVVEDEKIQGLVTLDNVKAVPRKRWESTLVKEAMTNRERMKTVRPDDDLATVLKIMTEADVNQVPVLNEGKIIGMIGRDHLLNFISVRASLSGQK